MIDTKSILASRSIWTSAITAVVGLAIGFKFLPVGFDAEPAIGLVFTALAVFNGYFRATATTQLVATK